MKIRAILLSCSILAVTACGGSSGGGGDSGGGDSGTGTGTGTGTGSSTTWTDTKMQTLVAAKCATSGCHNGSQPPNFKNISESGMKADTQAYSEVNAGRMPQGSSLTADEKATFKAFYGK